MNSKTVLMVLCLAAAGQAQMITVVNGASFSPMGPAAPGSFASIFGQELCRETVAAQFVGPMRLPTELGGCSVSVNGMPAMLHYVSPGQINFIVPGGLTHGSAQVTVDNNARRLSGGMGIGPAGPGVFSVNSMGVGEGAMLHGTMWQRGPFSTTTEGQPTTVSIYLTGLDHSTKPEVSIGGVPVEVLWHGPSPEYPGLDQINIVLPPGVAGVGRVPVTVTSSGQVSNVTFLSILPTSEMMQGMPGWGPGMMVGENMHRGREMSSMALNPATGTVLVTDEEDDAVRIISTDLGATLATITLPRNSQAHGIAVNATGTLAAVTLANQASVALIDLARNNEVSVIGTGHYPVRAVFTGASLLVTNAASGTVSVIDTNTRTLARTVNVGFGPYGIAATESLAIVANMQGGSLSLINLADYSVSTVDLPAWARPHEVAIATAAARAVITAPMSNGFWLLDLNTREAAFVETGPWKAVGPGAVAVHNNLAFIANYMTASVTVADVSTAAVVTTFPVDPGPRALAVNAAKNQLLVLSQGTGTLQVVNLNGYAILARINAGIGDRQGFWDLPRITYLSPASAQAGGPAFTLTITGSNLEDVTDVEFWLAGVPGGGMMGGGMHGRGGKDPNIHVSNVQANAGGSEVTCTVEILAAAEPGYRRIRLETGHGFVMMGPAMNAVLFNVTP